MSQVIEGGRCRILGGGQHGQDGDPLTVDVLHASAEDTVAVFPQDLEAAISVSTEPRRLVQLPYSADNLANPFLAGYFASGIAGAAAMKQCF